MKEKLIKAAQAALLNAYAPYSNYRVGAAILVDDEIFTGVNIENASYGLTICAERSALAAAISSGARKVKGIAIAVEKGAPSPCGACRQVLREFGTSYPVYLVSADGEVQETCVAELLPNSFGPNFLHEEGQV